jgi:hypothetical protein
MWFIIGDLADPLSDSVQAGCRLPAKGRYRAINRIGYSRKRQAR